MSDRQYTTFYLDDHLFGVDILYVREISRQLELTPVHRVGNHVRGLVNLRGQIVTVLDLGVKLALEPREVSATSRNIILKTEGELDRQSIHVDEHLGTGTDVVGLLVDRIGDVVTVDESEIERPPANVGVVSGKYLSGVVKLDHGLLSILKVAQVCA